jgi:hypothetical protein
LLRSPHTAPLDDNDDDDDRSSHTARSTSSNLIDDRRSSDSYTASTGDDDFDDDDDDDDAVIIMASSMTTGFTHTHPRLSPGDVRRGLCLAVRLPADASAQRAELTALLVALLIVPAHLPAKLYCDSAYIVDFAAQSRRRWQLEGWAHADLWRRVVALLNQKNVTILKVAAHHGVPGNEVADQLASEGRICAGGGAIRRLIDSTLEADRGPPPAPHDDIPTESELKQAIGRLRTLRSPGSDGITAETLRSVLQRATRGSSEDEEIFQELFRLVVAVGRSGTIPPQWADGVIVGIPKPGGGIRGITLLQAALKTLTNVLTMRLAQVQLDPVHTGFREHLSTAHAVAELRLRVRAAGNRAQRVFIAFLDIEKAYDCVCRPKMLEVLRARGFGDGMISLLKNMWRMERSVVRLQGRCSESFVPTRGLRQGDCMSPRLFLVLMDEAVREFRAVRPHSEPPILYADDVALTADTEGRLQQDVDAWAAALARIGLTINARKSKVLVAVGGTCKLLHNRVRDPTYDRQAHMAERVECPACGVEMRRQSLYMHLKQRYCRAATPLTPQDLRDDDSDDEPLLLVASRAEARQRTFWDIQGRTCGQTLATEDNLCLAQSAGRPSGRFQRGSR